MHSTNFYNQAASWHDTRRMSLVAVQIHHMYLHIMFLVVFWTSKPSTVPKKLNQNKTYKTRQSVSGPEQQLSKIINPRNAEARAKDIILKQRMRPFVEKNTSKILKGVQANKLSWHTFTSKNQHHQAPILSSPLSPVITRFIIFYNSPSGSWLILDFVGPPWVEVAWLGLIFDQVHSLRVKAGFVFFLFLCLGGAKTIEDYRRLFTGITLVVDVWMCREGPLTCWVFICSTAILSSLLQPQL